MWKPSVPVEYKVRVNQTSYHRAFNSSKLNILKTGKDNLQEIFSYVQWENKTTLSCWGNKEANTIKGQDGTKFWPKIDSTSEPLYWHPDLKRAVKLESRGKSSMFGISTFRFGISPRVWLSGRENAFNIPFHQFGRSGVANITSFEQGRSIGKANIRISDLH